MDTFEGGRGGRSVISCGKRCTTIQKRTAIYARVSTRDKGQDPETQLVLLRDWAARQDVEITEYVDQASGKDLNRPSHPTTPELNTQYRERYEVSLPCSG
jgi:hypothetical protein